MSDEVIAPFFFLDFLNRMASISTKTAAFSCENQNITDFRSAFEFKSSDFDNVV